MLWSGTTTLRGQEAPRVQVHVAPSVETPLGAWRADYGNAAMFRVRTDVSMNARNVLWAEFGARFGGGVRNTSQILDFLRNEYGYIMGNDGSPALVRVEGRGTNVSLGYGNRFWMKSAHSMTAEIGLLYMRHKIWFNNSGGVPMLTKPYVYGLDRLREGLGLQAALRYTYFDPNGVLNFGFALRGGVASTGDVRGTYYGGNPPSPTPQLDGFIGLEGTWYLPLAGKVGRPEGQAPNAPKVRYYQ